MQNKSDEKRRYERHRVSLPVEIIFRNSSSFAVTANISRHGAYLRTDSPAPERQLVKLSFKLPHGQELDVMGMVSRSIFPNDSSGWAPGMGVDFFSIGSEEKDIWEMFLKQLSKGTKVKDMEELSIPDPVKRKAPRFATSFLVRMHDKERLRDFYTKDISNGGMFLKTPLLKSEGDELEILLIHPESKREFGLGAKVVRVLKTQDRTKKGMALEFLPLDEKQKKQLEDFIETGVSFLDEGVEPITEV